MLSCPHHLSEDCTPSCGESAGFSCCNRCDTVSSFAGHGKESCWAVLIHHPELLKGVGRDGAIAEVEQFVCHMYGAPDVTGGCDKARRAFFELGKSLESLPQSLTPWNYTCGEPITKPKYDFRQTEKKLQMPHVTGKSSRFRRMGENKWCPKEYAVWARKPSVPESCLKLVTCKRDNSQCHTQACKCSVQSGKICLPACECAANGCLSMLVLLIHKE